MSAPFIITISRILEICALTVNGVNYVVVVEPGTAFKKKEMLQEVIWHVWQQEPTQWQEIGTHRTFIPSGLVCRWLARVH
jgi:hypothetical protein